MKIKQNYKKIIGISLIINIIFISLSVIFVLSLPSGNFTISSGIYPSGVSYTIWIEGTTCYAKNSFGQIDYSGINESVVINNAINNIDSLGGFVYLKSGVYDLDSSIIIHKPNIALIGEGSSETAGQGYNRGTKITSSKSISLIIVNSSTPASEGGMLRGVYLANLFLWGSGKDNLHSGIHAYKADVMKVVNVQSENSKYGIYLQNCVATQISLSAFVRNKIGCRIFSGTYNKIFESELSDNDETGLWLIALTSERMKTHIIGNSLRLNGEYGILCYRSGHNTIFANIFEENTLAGINLTSSSAFNSLTGNVFTCNYGHGITINDGSGSNTITGGSIRDSDFNNTATYDGIIIYGDSDETVISGIRLANNDRCDIHIVSSGCDYTIIGDVHTRGTDHEHGIWDKGTNTKVTASWNKSNWIATYP